MSDLESLLARHEGVRRFAYDDGTGKPVRARTTVRGKVTHRRLTQLSAARLNWTRLRSWRTLSEARHQVLISLCLNLGIAGLPAFKRMLAACERGDYVRAAQEMLASRWARQVVVRADELAQMMRRGDARVQPHCGA